MKSFLTHKKPRKRSKWMIRVGWSARFKNSNRCMNFSSIEHQGLHMQVKCHHEMRSKAAFALHGVAIDIDWRETRLSSENREVRRTWDLEGWVERVQVAGNWSPLYSREGLLGPAIFDLNYRAMAHGAHNHLDWQFGVGGPFDWRITLR